MVIVKPTAIARPVLTLPPAEAALLRQCYNDAKVILEYGSGGSTCDAAELPEKTVFSVESDKDWCGGLQHWFDANPPKAKVHLHHVDLGPTEKWGKPQSDKHWRRFHRYPFSVWDRADFQHPDVVFVDGRFRAACFLATLFSISRPVKLLFDDYTERPSYHEIEFFGPPAEIQGRLARFDLVPTPIPPARMSWIFDVFARQL